MRMLALEQSMGSDLGHDLTMANADPTFAYTSLTRPEWVCLNEMSNSRRKNDWLRGRNALKQVLSALGRDTDTSLIAFPHRQLSLTHAGGEAFSVADISRTSGVGIDYEPLRSVNQKITRWFLNPLEQAWLDSLGYACVDDQIVRLWTMKEAAFKSFPGNKDGSLLDFTVVEPGGRLSDVITAGGDHQVRVACELHEKGYLSVATCREDS
jgi:4'-phosphopantetheinyl transferase EntD